jgi:hypothetical protein
VSEPTLSIGYDTPELRQEWESRERIHTHCHCVKCRARRRLPSLSEVLRLDLQDHERRLVAQEQMAATIQREREERVQRWECRATNATLGLLAATLLFAAAIGGPANWPVLIVGAAGLALLIALRPNWLRLLHEQEGNDAQPVADDRGAGVPVAPQPADLVRGALDDTGERR